MKTTRQLRQRVGTLGYAMGFFFLFFNVTTSLAMEHMIIVDKWNEIFSALEKHKLF